MSESLGEVDVVLVDDGSELAGVCAVFCGISSGILNVVSSDNSTRMVALLLSLPPSPSFPLKRC